MFKHLDEKDPLKLDVQSKLLDKILSIIDRTEEIPKTLVSLLFHSIQWVGVKQLNQSLGILEQLFQNSSASQRQSLSLIMSTILSNRFDATIKDHCIDWYLKVVQLLKIEKTKSKL